MTDLEAETRKLESIRRQPSKGRSHPSWTSKTCLFRRFFHFRIPQPARHPMATELRTDSLKGGLSRFGREVSESEIHLALAAESLVVGTPEDEQHSRLKIINEQPVARQVLHLHEVRYKLAGCHSTDSATLPGRLPSGTACRTRARYRVEWLSAGYEGEGCPVYFGSHTPHIADLGGTPGFVLSLRSRFLAVSVSIAHPRSLSPYPSLRLPCPM